MTDVVYIKNEKGGIQSVTQDHYERYLTTRGVDGGVFPLPGVTVITEAQARKANPQLFGAHDPQVVFTDEELARKLKRQRDHRELYAEDEALNKAARSRGRGKAATPAPADSEETESAEGDESEVDDTETEE